MSGAESPGKRLQPFHLAFPVGDLASTRAFYGGVLGCPEGRSAERWVDFDLFGHQLSAHLRGDAGPVTTNEVDGDAVPVPHFGVVLAWDDFHALADRLQKAAVDFILEPRIRFKGQVGEQATMFLRDPSGNALEFKAFRDPARLFATGD
jgi:extradiol dioxygenase family protein